MMVAKSSQSHLDAVHRYNQTAYTQLAIRLPKDLVAKFKAKCDRTGISQASIFKDAIEEFLKD